MFATSHRCIRCGSDADERLLCDTCFQHEWNRVVMQVPAKPVQSPFVRRALARELPSKEVKY